MTTAPRYLSISARNEPFQTQRIFQARKVVPLTESLHWWMFHVAASSHVRTNSWNIARCHGAKDSLGTSLPSNLAWAVDVEDSWLAETPAE